jgi:hypothetical protein
LNPYFATPEGNVKPQQYNPHHAPDDLKALTQWVVWRYAERKGKTTKIPMQPRHAGRMARSNDPTTWSTFDHASRVCEANPTLDGAGFVFSGDDPYVGTDLDNCRDPETGVVDPWAAGWIRRFGGYAEVSPSGTGVKIIVKGSLPSSIGKTIVDSHETEMYDRGRFFTITGWTLHGSTDPEDAQEAVEELHALMMAAKPATKPARRSEGGGKATVPTGPIPEGMRHATIRSILGAAHNGTRNLEDLAEIAHAVNAERCQPPIGSTPQDDPISDLQDLARWVFSKEPSKPSKDPEIDRIAGDAWADWWKTLVPGGGRSKVRDSARTLIENHQKHGTVIEAIVNGEKRKCVAASLSCRQGGKAAGTSHASFATAMHKLVEAGKVMPGPEPRRDEEAQTWLILDPATGLDTPSQPAELVGGVKVRRGPVETPCLRWRHPVSNSKVGALYAVEVQGPKTAGELAEILGHKRERDLRRNHLDGLVARGVLLLREDGRYACPDDYAQRMEAERNETYVSWRRRRVTVDPSGRVVKWVEEGDELSDIERDARDEARYEEQRKTRRLRRKARVERACFGVSPVIVEHGGNLVNLETGVIVGEIGEPEETAAEDEHRDGCQCVICEYERLREVG